MEDQLDRRDKRSKMILARMQVLHMLLSPY